ncbi:uncharacterized protein LOC129568042 [Sitodiplosis mosellana]|uniref:uncharacterized protein LOC129568042 n=1 Tax=Sitodiplosis mosellana TaxID=263140 RepID=UPI002443DDE7|nr:uncharacterized protein LOC129568042 [Sitodiplosis mosellana]
MSISVEAKCNRARLGASPDEHMRFFTEMLGDIDEPTLPFGLSDVTLGIEIHEAKLKLSQTLNDQLREHAPKLQVSLASICHLAWAQVLSRSSDREAVVFGTVLLGRLQTGEGNNDIMGPMINTLPIRIDVDERSVETAVRHTHARLSALLTHEHIPLALAQRCSGCPAGLPLFSAILNYRHNHKSGQVTASLPGVKFFDREGRTNYPLTMSLDDNDVALHLSVQAFSPMSAARICAYMQQALESLADALTQTPQQQLRTLEVIPPEERTMLVHTWNQTTVTHPSLQCLHQLFEAQVERNGHLIAVECNGEMLSYSKLNAQANRLAHYLISRGVKPDDRIALCFERSTTMIVAMLGILKAGGAYVPLDPAYQSQRLTQILEDAEPKFVLADTTGRKALGDHQVPVLDIIESLSDDLPIKNPDANHLGVTPTHLAYVIYTSGSTGRPKGVMVEHHHASKLLQSVHDQFDTIKEDKWCSFSSFSFDSSVLEIWGALCYGCQLSIVPYTITRSVDEFYDWICNREITVLKQTPSAFKMLMLAKNISSRSNKLRYVLFGGEALDPSIVMDWKRKYGETRTVLVNVYGPTETVVDATFWVCDHNNSENLPVVPIGRPLLNKRIYLLNTHGELVPLGAEGEIYIGGAGVARGYLNRPELTAERFLSDPFSDEPAARMYRTGDRARYLPDGNLVYLGRTDQQVKIRGFRIELGEIEAHLVAHPQVYEAVVQSYGNGADSRLVAYVVADKDRSLVQILRIYLTNILPEYMVPAAYVCLPSLPLTPNRKLDRRALPPPDDEAFARQHYEYPQGRMEEKLADIWCELLSIERISRHDNFFTLGGHSLLVVRLLAQLRHIGLDTTAREVFDAPSLATLAATLTRYQAVEIPPNLITADSKEITPEMLPLISLSQAEINAIIAQIPGGVANIQDIYGLAPFKSGILFHHIKAERGDPYLLLHRMHFTDRMALERYADALQQVVSRHDILRTVFIWEGLNEPAQVVLRRVPSLLTKIILDDDTGESVLERLSHQFNPRHYRLQLTKAPLLRLMASKTSEGSWVALQLIHQIISDHTSTGKLVEEVHAIIDEKIEKMPTPTPFRHFVAQTRLGPSPDEHMRFFTEMLGDIDEPTLPFGLSDVTFGTEIHEAKLKLPQTLNDQLREHARKLQVSLASICHLAWAQVLSRSSNREAVVFGTVLLGRLQTGEGNNDIMGPMMNTLPIRIDIDESTVGTAVRRTHARLSALLAHEQAPLVLAQRCSGVPAGLPLFSALLNYRHNQKRLKVTASLPGVTFLGEEERTNYPLALSVEDDGDSLGLTAQIISPMSAARIGAYMQQALVSLADALTHKPRQPVRSLAVMPPEERTLLLHTLNQTTVDYPSDCCLHQLLEAQVKRDGQAIAVECEGKTLSYAGLNVQANQLANYLITRGVKPDNRVALCVERSTTMIVAMLGILKAGAAYVPLDPVYPSQRLANILLDADPIFLLADAAGRSALGNHQVPVIDLDKPLPVDLPMDNPDAKKLGVTPTNLAYVIYTSGSTGAPKGVMVEHHDAAHLFQSVHDKFDFNTQDKWCLFHSISFDLSVWEIWGALLNGNQLWIVPSELTRSTDEFYDWICTSGITVLTQTPSVFRMLMRAQKICSQFNQLRYLIFCGEALEPSIVKDWYEKYDKIQTVLVNMYGPTETVIFATNWICDNTISENSLTPIGRPLSNKRSYLLDQHGEPVPLGADGELYIGGAGVARGYLNRSELTAERFLPDPFSDNPASRMYRTGDRARYLPDGNLVYLGRTDQQVKIRGFRIELGEIEARLIEHHLVHEAVVQHHDNGSDARLVAYVVADANTLKSQDLRTYLSTLLPEYMVPAAFVCLPSLPLTTSGKLDRRALPAPDEESFAREEYEALQGEMEKKLSNIWRKLLSIERIGRHDNFFALGGHSLLVVRLLSELRRIGLDTTVREVFDAPNLAALASSLAHYQAMNIPLNLITTDSTAITPDMLPFITLSQAEIDAVIAQVPGGIANIQDIYGLAPLQNGMLFHHVKAERGDPYLLINRMRFTDRTELERYTDALQQVVSRHDILRTVFIWEGLNEPAQVVLRRIPSLLTEITLDDDTGELVLEQLCQQFNPRHYRLQLTQAPLLRLMTAPTSDESWVALLLMHHIIADHSTLEKLMAEVHVIIDEKIEELTTPTPFRYHVAQTRQAASPDEHMRFFTEMLGDIDEPTLPFGLSDIGLDGTEINEGNLKLPQTLNDQLREHARKLQVSLASICHLAWAQVLARASGREAVVFGTVLLGRLQTGEGNNDIMGPTINTLPIRIDIDERSVQTAVRHTHGRLSTLLAYEHAPLVLAQRCSGCPAGLPLFSTILNYRHNRKIEQGTASLPGVNFLGGEGRTNYPLCMSLDDSDVALCLSVQVESPMSAARICGYMQQALESLADAIALTPQQHIRTLTVIPPEERTMLLHNWNQTTVNYPPARCLHQLFEAQVERDGQAIAVECNGEELSYAKLNAQANQLAHYLIERGVKPDDRIALCVERNTTMIVTMLGILKAGGTYVPLDLAYPSQRLSYILEDAKPIFLLTDTNGHKALRDHHPLVLNIQDRTLFAELPDDNPDSIKLGLNPDHLAYVIYTSGSTGTPKGVMIEHRSLFSLVQTIPRFEVSPNSRVLQFASCSFDNSIWEIVLALTTGARLCMPNVEERLTDTALLKYIKAKGITHADLGPSLFRNTKNLSDLNDLKVLILGNEAPNFSLISAASRQTVVYNVYGLTETTVNATFWLCPKDFDGDPVPMGRPLPFHCRTYVLDSNGEPVPLGAEGELYIGGAGVARGYLNRPELTAERFLPDPFSDNPKARIYRTGDRARYLSDGNLVYMGRIDQQVKIRGFRIELGEIEAHLVEHPQVHQAVVQPYGNGSDARLVAYVVTNADISLARDLRTFLSNLLPEYMVPAAYVCLSSLPLTPNGKLDRRALPAPDDEAFVRQQYEAPQGEMEEKLADIWSELLGIDRISRHDNFFESGGHSLLVMQFVNKVKLYNIHIDARGVFSFPVLKDLAEQITHHTNRFYSDAAIPVRQHGYETPLFLLPDGWGDISYAFELANDIDKNIPIYVLPWSPPENKLPSSMEEMAYVMVTLMRKIQANGPYAIAGYSSGGILAYEMAKQLLKSGGSVSFLGLIDTYPTNTNPRTETETFLSYLMLKVPVIKVINDSKWWTRVSKLTLNEAIDEVKKINIGIKNIDFEWETLLSKQRHNFQNMCASVKIDSLPIKIHLFKAANHHSLSTFADLDNVDKSNKNSSEKLFNPPKVGWEKYIPSADLNIIIVDGDHYTMMTDSKNRLILGKEINKAIQISKIQAAKIH